MKIDRRLHLLPLCLFGLLVAVAHADDKETATSVVKTMTTRVLTVLKSDGLSTEQKLDNIVDVISQVFDFPLMAKLTLGKQYWPQLNEKQQADFTDLFIAKLKRVYTGKVEAFSDEQVTFEEAEVVGNKVHIRSFVVSKGDRISVNYKLYQSGDSWRVYDLEVQDVSIVQSYRSQFTPIIRDKSAEALLAELRSTTVAEAEQQKPLR